MTTHAPTLAAWLALAPFGLTLSSGFFGFFAHAGVVHALAERHLRPTRISGSSAGALIGASWAAGLSPSAISDRLLDIQKRDFWDPFPGPGLIRGKRFERLLNDWLPVKTFGECRVPLAVSVYDVLGRRTRVLDSGALAPAIRASCAVPLMFHPVWMRGRPYLDGGVLDRPGLAGMPCDRVLYHHLSSRSPWRAADGAQTLIPKRPGLIALIFDELPRAGPDALDQGVEAYHVALNLMRDALDRPAPAHVLRLSA